MHKYLLGRRRWRLVSVKWLAVSLQIRGSAEAEIGLAMVQAKGQYKCPFTGKNEALRSVTLVPTNSMYSWTVQYFFGPSSLREPLGL